MRAQTAWVLCAGMILSACSGAHPVLYDNTHLQTVGKDEADQDIEACKEAAESAGAEEGSGKAGRVAASTGVGAGVGAALGASLGGYLRDVTGGYETSFVISTLAFAAAVALIWSARPSSIRVVRKVTDSPSVGGEAVIRSTAGTD